MCNTNSVAVIVRVSIKKAKGKFLSEQLLRLIQESHRFNTADFIVCQCGAINVPHTRYCDTCGKEIAAIIVEFTIEPGVICPRRECGHINPLDAIFCGECGWPVSVPYPAWLQDEPTEVTWDGLIGDWFTEMFPRWKCPSCGHHNDAGTLVCLNCLAIRREECVVCPFDGVENVLNQEACGVCGAQLWRVCTDCGAKHEVVKDEVFCVVCGSYLPGMDPDLSE